MGIQPLFRLLIACLLGCAVLPAQQHTHVAGLILDPSGAAIPNASVTVVSQETGFRRLTRSRNNGWYAVASLQPGLYKITVRKDGFRTLIRFGVKLDAAQPGRLDFTLPLGTVPEAITVTGSPALINSHDASVGTLIDRDRIEKLPLNGRGLLSLLEFAPGTVVTAATRGEAGQFSTSGQRPNANYFMVDGVSANTGVSGGGLPARSTGGSLPGMTAIGSLHGLVSLEALEEFRVQTSTSAPEFGKLPGAQVLLSSRSGSNEFHGSAFSYLRRGVLDANNWFSNRHGVNDSPLAVNDFGATFGGPLKRNRAFFFLSYEGMRLQEPFAWQSPAPTEQARQGAPDWAQPALGLFPLPNGQALGPNLAEWRGQYDRDSRLDVASIRLDHAPTSRLTTFGRYSFTRSVNEFTATQVNDLSIRSDSLTLGASYRVSSAAVLEFRMNRSSSAGESIWHPQNQTLSAPCALNSVPEFLFRTDPCDYLLRLSIAGVGSVVSGVEGDQQQNQWHLLPMAVVSLGSHQLRIGADFRRYVPQRNDRTESISVIAENFDDLNYRRNLWVARSQARSVGSILSELSAFAQDTWRIHPRLTANFGLRWEYARDPRYEDPSTVTDPLVAEDFPPRWGPNVVNLAPRIGIAYRLSSDGRTVVRGGWGRFFDSALSIGTDLVNGGPFSLTQFSNGKNAPFSTLMSFGFAPNLRLPKVNQWNVTVERRLIDRDVLSASYVGSTGRRLLRREFGLREGTGTFWLALATNHGESDYHGLQVQYRRPMTKGVQALASYTWSHSIDNSSSDSLLHRVGTGLNADLDRGPSDFDVRQSLNAALTYETEPRLDGSFPDRLLRGWSVDGIFRARTGFPIAVLNSEFSNGLSFANAFRPNMVAGQPVWVDDPAAAGGRRLNENAFAPASGFVQGSLGRNAIRGFGMRQIDLSLRRQFPLSDRHSLLFRLEVFNLFNRPNFGDPERFLTSPLFGESLSTLNLMLGTGSPGSGLTPLLQTGGARSVQLVIRFRF